MTKKGSKTKKAAPAAKPANDQAAKPKQLKFGAEGMQRKKIVELDKKAAKYRAQRDLRMRHTELETQLKAELVEEARKHLQPGQSYVFEGEEGEEFVVEYEKTTSEKENVKVSKRSDDTSEDD